MKHLCTIFEEFEVKKNIKRPDIEVKEVFIYINMFYFYLIETKKNFFNVTR